MTYIWDKGVKLRKDANGRRRDIIYYNDDRSLFNIPL
jgi:hypothetical protein